MILSHIVACSKNRVIGQGGGMPWHIPADFKYFKRITMGHAMVMGRKTFESIGAALPGRLSIIVTRQADYRAAGAVTVPSIDQALALAAKRRDEWGEEVFIIGGGEIFKETMAMVDRIYLTHIERDIPGDTYYPAVSESEFRLVSDEPQEGDPPFSFQVYERRKTGEQ